MRQRLATVLTVTALVLIGCSTGTTVSTDVDSGAAPQTSPLPLWETDAGPGAQRIVVISDIHLGVDDSLAETVKNRAMLTDFLRRSAVSDMDEMVIAGDFLDEWFLPATYPPHVDSSEFYRQVKANNTEVFAALEEIMANGITLTYVPGNHDMLLDEDTLDELLPGIQQSRDVDGLGSRRTGARSEIVIEHGHRYDAGAAPDSLSNKEVTGADASILPVGYFLTRMIVTSVAEGKSAPVKELPVIPAPTNGTDEQIGAYALYRLWSQVMSNYPIQASMDDPVFHAEFDGYPEPVSLRDLVPALRADGSIGAPLYGDLPRQWDALQAANRAASKNPFDAAITAAFNHAFLDKQAQTQYFDREPQTDVVVFGHSHVPLVAQFTEKDERPTAYANSGTWIDHSLLGPTGTFVAIDSGTESTDVRVLQYRPDGGIDPVPAPK